MQHRQRPDPYCAFKNDVERRRALVARDVRLVLIAVVVACSSTVSLNSFQALAAWLKG